MPSVLEVHTWREDWAEEQKKTMPEIQQTVRGVAEDGTVLVTPVRTTTQDRASEYLEDLDYRYGKGSRRIWSSHLGCANRSKQASTGSKLRLRRKVEGPYRLELRGHRIWKGEARTREHTTDQRGLPSSLSCKGRKAKPGRQQVGTSGGLRLHLSALAPKVS